MCSSDLAIRGAFDFPKIPAWKMHHELNELSNQYFISIDLGANDDLLVKEFKAWLKKFGKLLPYENLKLVSDFLKHNFAAGVSLAFCHTWILLTGRNCIMCI